jgi:fumarylacetoacetate (FAA) hydrolase family protein
MFPSAVAQPQHMSGEQLASAVLPVASEEALLVGRAWIPESTGTPAGPSLVLVRDRMVLDVSALAPKAAELLALDDLALDVWIGATDAKSLCETAHSRQGWRVQCPKVQLIQAIQPE